MRDRPRAFFSSRQGILRLVVAFALWPSIVLGATVRQLCDLTTPATGPFPNDRFTVVDASQNTRLRVNLPKPDCSARPSDCADLDVINTLDGFSLQPRLAIPFDGAIDVRTVTSATVYLLRIGDAGAPPLRQQRRRLGVNRVLWDPATLTLFAEPDELLEQHTRYAIVVTTGVRDADGNPVALAASCASTFTTRSVTAVLEKIRNQIKASRPNRADFLLGPGNARTVFSLNDVTQITVSRQTGVNPARFAVVPGTVGRIAFGRYAGADYLTHPGEFVATIGTATGIPRAQGMQDLYFNVYLPTGQAPIAGWPVAIIGHGANGSKEGGTISVTTKNGVSVTFPAGGRGFDQNGDGTIAAREGDAATAPRALLASSPGIQQTAADLMQLVRVIQMGVDIDGDLRTDLDPGRIYFVGNSLGGGLGVVFAAVEPDVRAAVFINPAGPITENNRLSPLQRANVGTRLASRVPSLINGQGVTSVGGIAVGAPLFNENKPLRNQAPIVNTVAGAMDIQVVLEWMNWIPQAGSPVTYIRHLRQDPLGGAKSKPVLYYFGKGDQDIPNMNTSETLVAGGLVDRAIYYRHDLAFAENPATLPKDPHVFAFGFRTGRLDLEPVAAIARAAQEQIAVFLESFGALVVQPQPVRFFETPIKLPLPDAFNYIP